MTTDNARSARARAWRDALRAPVCDVREPWAHGMIERATRYPSYYDLNVVRVQGDPPLGVEALIDVADGALAGLDHRRVDFDLLAAGERRCAGFEARGWRVTRVLWMRHEAAPPPGPGIEVEEVPYEAVDDLRVAWHREDYPDVDPAGYLAESHEVALRRGGVQVLAVREGGALVGFAQLERIGAAAEVGAVYVHPEHRGGGRGTATTRAAIAAVSDVDDLWIAADADDRPKELYARLGFRPAWTTIEFLRLP